MLGRRAVGFASRPEAAACSTRSRLSLAEYLGRDCRHDSTRKYMPLHISTLARSCSKIDVGLKRRIAQRFQKLATQRTGSRDLHRLFHVESPSSYTGYNAARGRGRCITPSPFSAATSASVRAKPVLRKNKIAWVVESVRSS